MKKFAALLLALLVVFSLSVPAFAAPAENLISEDKAKEIALEHAGLNASDVRFVKVRLDFDDGRYEYEIEFVSENVEYEYSVNAENGRVVEFDRDYEAPRKAEAFSLLGFFRNLLSRIFGFRF